MRRIYYRTVKNNHVRILGKILGNENLRNGELDGKRLCFIIYLGIPDSGWLKDGLAALWGTEATSKALNKGVENRIVEEMIEEDGKLLAPNGYFSWYFWREVSVDEDYEAKEADIGGKLTINKDGIDKNYKAMNA